MTRFIILLLSISFFIKSSSAFTQQGIIKSNYVLTPKGEYNVGQVYIDLLDSNRYELATSEVEDFRQIPIQIWYPVDKGTIGTKSSYRPRVEAFRSNWGDASVDFIKNVKTEIIDNAEISKVKPFGVLLFSHGWGARSSSHTTYLSNIASYGYIVVGINHPYMGNVALSNGMITEPSDSHFKNQEEANRFYAEDVVFVINHLLRLNQNDPTRRFTKSIDISKLFAAGHSSGFPAVSNAAVIDDRIKGLISFDSGVPSIVRRKGLEVPILLFRADKNSYTDLFFRGENTHPKGTIYNVDFFRRHKSDFYDLVILETTHSSIYDEYIFAEKNDEKIKSIRNHKLFLKYSIDFMNNLHSKFNQKLSTYKMDKNLVTLRYIGPLKENN